MTRFFVNEHGNEVSVQQNSNNFGTVLSWIGRGGKASREGWNGKGMYIYIHTQDLAFHLSQINMHTVDDREVAWTASHTDLLSVDWTLHKD